MILYLKENGAKKLEYQKVFVFLPEKSKYVTGTGTCHISENTELSIRN